MEPERERRAVESKAVSNTRRDLVIGYAAAAVLLLSGGFWVLRNWDQVHGSLSFEPIYLAVLAPLVFVSIVLIGLMNQLICSELGAPLRFREWVALAFASTLANYTLPMRAGAAIRAAYYKKTRDLSLASFSVGMGAAYLVTLMVNALIGAAMLVRLGPFHGGSRTVLFVLFVVALSVCLMVLVLPVPKVPAGDRLGIGATVRMARRSWEKLRGGHRLYLRLLLVSAGSTLLFALRIKVAFIALGQSVSIVGCLLIGALVALSMFVTVTPAALGVREAAVAVSSTALGLSPEWGLIAGAADRAAAILVVVAVGIPATAFLSVDVGRCRAVKSGW